MGDLTDYANDLARTGEGARELARTCAYAENYDGARFWLAMARRFEADSEFVFARARSARSASSIAAE